MAGIYFEIQDLVIVKEFKGTLSPINIFVGPNNSGKSLICKTILNYINDSMFSDVIYTIKSTSESFRIRSNVSSEELSEIKTYYLPDSRLVIRLLNEFISYINIIKDSIERLKGTDFEYIYKELDPVIGKLLDLFGFRLTIESYMHAKKSSLSEYIYKLKKIWEDIVERTWIDLNEIYSDNNPMSKELLNALAVDIIDSNKLYVFDNIQRKKISNLSPLALSGGVATYFIVNWLTTILSTPDEKQVLLIEEIENQSHPLLQIMISEFIYDSIKYVIKNIGKQVHLLLTTHSPFVANTFQYKYRRDMLREGNEIEDFIHIYYPLYDKQARKFIYKMATPDIPIFGFIDANMLIWKRSPIEEISNEDTD